MSGILGLPQRLRQATALPPKLWQTTPPSSRTSTRVDVGPREVPWWSSEGAMEERDGFSDGEVSGSFFLSQELGVSGWMFLSPSKMVLVGFPGFA